MLLFYMRADFLNIQSTVVYVKEGENTMQAHHAPAISMTTKNNIARFFRLYIPLTHVREFKWNSEQSDHHITMCICSEQMPYEAIFEKKINRILKIKQQLHLLGFKCDDAPTLTWNNAMGTWEGRVKFIVSNIFHENADNLPKEKGYPELFNLNDYFKKVMLLLKNTHTKAYQEIRFILDTEDLLAREKLILFEKTVFRYATSFFQNEQIKAVLTEFLMDLPAIIDIQRDQFKKIHLIKSEEKTSFITKFDLMRNDVLDQVIEKIQYYFSDPKQNLYTATLLANIVGLFSDFINRKNIKKSVDIILGFLLLEFSSFFSSSGCLCFLQKSSGEKTQYANTLRALIYDIKSNLHKMGVNFAIWTDERLIAAYDQYIEERQSNCELSFHKSYKGSSDDKKKKMSLV